MRSLIQWGGCLLYGGCMTFAWSQESPRITPAVRVIEQIQPSVVPIFAMATKSAGSGAVFHESGFILTADHVTTNSPGVALFGLERADYEVIGRVPERDLAVLRVRSSSKLKSPIRLGRSNELRIGEPIIVGGNPGGRGIVYSHGIINSASIEPSWPSILVKSFWQKETDDLGGRRERSTGGRPDFIQFDATTNKGNSGGPVVNFENSLVGLVALKGLQEEGTNWAIPVDRIRMFMPYLVPAEAIGGFEVGLEIDMLADKGLVLSTRQGAAAWDAGIRPGDVIRTVDGQPIRQGHEWLLALWGHKSGDKLNVTLEREMKMINAQMELRAVATQSALDLTDKIPGVQYQFYDGLFPFAPDYSVLKPAKQGVVGQVDLKLVNTMEKRSYSIVYSGYIEFAEAGLVRMGIGSDDGSKLYLDNQLVIDNDLAHGFQTLTRWVRVPRGLVPFRVEFIEVGGDRGLVLSATQDIEAKKPVAMKFFTDRLNQSE